MGCAIWSSPRHHSWSRRTVQFPSLEAVSTVAWNQMDSDHLPPQWKWFGATFPLPTKSTSKMSIYPRKMDKFATNGVIRRAHSNQEWLTLQCSRTSIQHYIVSSCKLFHSSGNNTLGHVTYVTMLKEMMKQLWATLTHHHAWQKPFVSSNHSAWALAFVPQSVPQSATVYHVPHKVIECRGKTFTTDVNGMQEVISLDHLKPACIEDLLQ